MNSSLWSADRTTHLRIVAVSLIAAVAVVAVGINARIADIDSVAVRMQADIAVIKANKPTSYSVNKLSEIQ